MQHQPLSGNSAIGRSLFEMCCFFIFQAMRQRSNDPTQPLPNGAMLQVLALQMGHETTGTNHWSTMKSDCNDWRYYCVTTNFHQKPCISSIWSFSTGFSWIPTRPRDNHEEEAIYPFQCNSTPTGKVCFAVFCAPKLRWTICNQQIHIFHLQFTSAELETSCG